MRVTLILNTLLLGIILLVIFNIVQNSFQFFSIKKRIALVQNRFNKVEQRNQQLKSSRQQRQYAYFWQQQIRNKLHLVQKKEVLVQIPASIKGDQDSDSYLPKNSSYVNKTIIDPNWKKWLKVMDF